MKQYNREQIIFITEEYLEPYDSVIFLYYIEILKTI